MKILRIERVSEGPDCTLAVWSIEGTGFESVGIARPWLNNEPNVSCIPKGVYMMTLGMYNAGGYPAYEILDVPERTLCKLHKANKASSLLGCEAPGTYVTVMDGEVAVAASGNKFNEFMATMGSDPTAILQIV